MTGKRRKFSATYALGVKLFRNYNLGLNTGEQDPHEQWDPVPQKSSIYSFDPTLQLTESSRYTQ
ncbi:hypothetical protein WG66_011244 [Moniliophthora roreri]|nr:hypothetical protein WG66_011244 [Moniliophthora roreri]